MVVFLGQITNSQVAINNGTVTQTMTRQLSESRWASTNRPPAEPESTFPRRGSSLPGKPAWKPMPTDLAGMRNEPRISAEVCCQVLLFHVLTGLLARIDRLPLSREERNAVRREVLALQADLVRTPFDEARVDLKIEELRARLEPTGLLRASSAERELSRPRMLTTG
ncbi:hypothetical protein ACWD3J_00405 [Streptomyces sp. NPDC002755]|uniref:hypothetical protein n=1 Tax=Streptomyces sp. NPDC002884 TaxID=3154544 RepID=UPI003330EA39